MLKDDTKKTQPKKKNDVDDIKKRAEAHDRRTERGNTFRTTTTTTTIGDADADADAVDVESKRNGTRR